MNILGISAYYHDSAAALIVNGKIVSAAQEERFTRKKHDPSFPAHAIKYCLASQDISINDVDYVVFYDKPLLTFDRLLETFLSQAPRGFRTFLKALPVWLKEKLYLKSVLRKELEQLGAENKGKDVALMFSDHHHAHAASAYYPSPFQESAVLCLDGVGEWATTSVWHGKGADLTPLWQIDFPHSLGMLYSAFTYYCGFKVNSGEYKLMGLAPYGEPRYVEDIKTHLIDIKPDGTYRLNMKYFNFLSGLTMTSNHFHELFGGPPREAESELTQHHMDLARSIQVVTEEIVLLLGKTIHAETGCNHLCMAGGVALNCVSNGRLLREGPFDSIWIQPASGDAGGSVGSALAVHHQFLENPKPEVAGDLMDGSYLGPSYTADEIIESLDKLGAVYELVDENQIPGTVAQMLAESKVCGWWAGRMEFGPRSLGARSILGNALDLTTQSTMNLKIKYRESFRPFAPSVLAEYVQDYFKIDSASPYMLQVAEVEDRHRINMSEKDESLFGIDKLNVPRSTIPSITHVDYSARIQTVHRETNPRYHAMISEFHKLTGCPIVVNTSFNVRGEPIVCTVEDAYKCFMRTEMDNLILENVVLYMDRQPEQEKDESWRDEFELD